MSFIKQFQTQQKELIELTNENDILKRLQEHKELNGFEEEGRITFNKILDKKSFGQFNNIVTGLVPLDLVFDDVKSKKLPSFAKVLKHNLVAIYPKYLYQTANMEYEDWQNEEDQEHLEEFLKFVAANNKPTIAVGILRSEEMGSAHAIAIIAWKRKIAFFDSLAYKRSKNNSGYEFAKNAFREDRFDLNVTFVDITQHCLHTTNTDFHCPQYVMNAEYCYVYSLYFLYEWIVLGAKTTTSCFDKAVKKTYVVDPSKLSRANTPESFLFRLVIMSFTMSCLSHYLVRSKNTIPNTKEYLAQIEEYNKSFEEQYGISLKI